MQLLRLILLSDLDPVTETNADPWVRIHIPQTLEGGEGGQCFVLSAPYIIKAIVSFRYLPPG